MAGEAVQGDDEGGHRAVTGPTPGHCLTPPSSVIFNGHFLETLALLPDFVHIWYDACWMASLGKQSLGAPVNHYLENVEILSCLLFPPSGMCRRACWSVFKVGAERGGLTNPVCLSYNEDFPRGRP